MEQILCMRPTKESVREQHEPCHAATQKGSLLQRALEVPGKEDAASALPKSNRFLLPLMTQAICNLPLQNPNLVLTCCAFNSAQAAEPAPAHTLLQAGFHSLATSKVIPGTIKSTRWRLTSSHSKYYAAQFSSYFPASESDKCCIMCKPTYTNKSMREHEQKYNYAEQT